MVTAAGMAIVAKGLVQAKPLAMTVFCLVVELLKTPTQPAATEAMSRSLADMQGVSRLSNLLCPILDSLHGYVFVSG